MSARRPPPRRPAISPLDDWRIGPLSLALSGLIRGLAATVDFRLHDDACVRSWEAEGRQFILAFWHRHLILMRYAYRGARMTVLVSQSWDGELTSQTLAHLGIETSRGSTSSGGAAALRDLLRRARSGSDIAFTPDGPRGPVHKVQPGVAVAAALSGLPVVPVAIGATRRKLLRSWDRMLVPLPGARVEVVYGPPLTLAPRAPLGEGVERIEQALLAVERRAEELAGTRGMGGKGAIGGNGGSGADVAERYGRRRWMKSMTGFGQSIVEADGLQISVTLQGVNHRYLDLVVRLPEELRFLDGALRERLGGVIRRGRCEAALGLRRAHEAEVEVELRIATVKKLIAACQPLVESGELEGRLTIGDLARSPTFLRVEKSSATWSAADDDAVWRSFDEALAQFEEARSAEGRRIAGALSQIFARLLETAAALRARLPAARAAIAESLRARLREWTSDSGLDEERLLSELAVLAEKSDVQEEMDRLAAHLEQIEEVTGRPGPIGRHLDFLAQELLRELNTLCAKCRDTRVVQLGLDARLLCEQIREQVQNVE